LREGYDIGFKKSKENKQIKEKEMDTWKHGYGHCVSVEEGSLRLVMEVAKAIALKEAELTAQNDSSIQTDNTTTDVDTQMTPFNEIPSPSPSSPPSLSPSQLSTLLTAMMTQIPRNWFPSMSPSFQLLTSVRTRSQTYLQHST
jgi:hypothetical protein